jgi:subtilisin family serine protease
MFMKFAGIAGSLALGVGPVSAQSSGDSQRFLIDLRKVSRSEVPESVEIVHDLSEIDVLAVRGDPESVGDEDTIVPDVELTQHGVTSGEPSLDDFVEKKHDSGPAMVHAAANGQGMSLPARQRLQWDNRAQNLEDVHEITEGEGTRIGIIDSGIYADHPDLDGVVNRNLSKNFTGDGEGYFLAGAGTHGTHVAGITAATNDYNGKRGGVLGTAPEAELLALRVFSDSGGAMLGDILAAIRYGVDTDCDALNMSLGLPITDIEKHPVLRKYKKLFERAATYANERGTVVISSAGNAALDLDPKDVLGVPAEAPSVFAVSATGPIGFLWDDGPLNGNNEEEDEEEDEDLDYEELPPLQKPTTEPARYTNYGGSVIDVSAGGGNFDPEAVAEYSDGDANRPKWFYDLVISTVFTQQNGNVSASYGFKAGTSMSSPQVAGAVALVRSLQPELSVREVEEVLRNTASDIGESDYRGDGHLDLTALVAKLSSDEKEGADGNR